MNLWHKKDTSEIVGAHTNLTGNLEAISGNCTSVWGQSFISGDVTDLQGSLTGLTGSCQGLSGQVTRVRGNVSRISGLLDERLIGDVSGLSGDVSSVWGKADSLRGATAELLERGLLWPKDRELTLEMFASRHNLPMEFLDNSGMPALIAFYALEGVPLHWVTVCSQNMDGFTVGSLSVISARSPGQEIIKVALPSDAHWQLLDKFDLLSADRIYAFEQLASPVHTVMN